MCWAKWCVLPTKVRTEGEHISSMGSALTLRSRVLPLAVRQLAGCDYDQGLVLLDFNFPLYGLDGIVLAKV